MKSPTRSSWNDSFRSVLLCALALLGLPGAAPAQTAPPSPAGPNPQLPAAPKPLYDPQQLPAYTGQVRQFTLTPRGDIDGMVLGDGTEIKTPPHLSTQLAYSIKPGDSVTVHGLHAASLPLVQAVSVTDDANGRTIIDDGPPGPGRRPGAPPASPPRGAAADAESPISGLTEVQGRVRMVLHGPRGDANGALLDDGAILRLPPNEVSRLADLLQPGKTVVAEGAATVNALGKVIEVRQIGPSREQLGSVAAPPGPKHRPRP